MLNCGATSSPRATGTLADEYQSCVETLPEEPEQRIQERNGRLLKLATRIAGAFRPLQEACPAYIRKLDEAVRQALGAEEASKG
jgi:hypothetical protein